MASGHTRGTGERRGMNVRHGIPASLLSVVILAGCAGQGTPLCGDGVLEPPEQCDDGAANSDSTPGACRMNCTVARCGDGVIDPGESCDNGAQNGVARPGSCRNNCTVARCGDGIVDPGEDCDDGVLNGSSNPGA